MALQNPGGTLHTVPPVPPLKPLKPCLRASHPQKPQIVYDLSIMNNENEVSMQNPEMSVISSSSRGTVQNNANAEPNREVLNGNANKAILIQENYCINEEKKIEKTEKSIKKSCPCSLLLKPKKLKGAGKQQDPPPSSHLEVLYKTELCSIPNSNSQPKPRNLYRASDYLAQNEGEPDSIPSNSTRNEEPAIKKPESGVAPKEKCQIF